MRKSVYISFFLILSFSGYSCQMARYCTATYQYNSLHNYNKSLTKKVIALRINSFRNEKKIIPLKRKKIKAHYKKNVLVFTLASPKQAAVSIYKRPFFFSFSYLSPLLFSSGKRGPPAFISFS